MTAVPRGTLAGRAYLDLQNKARRDGRTTDELIHLYALEGILARLSVSAYVHQLVLKGGVLLAAFGDRRPTRDVDLAGIDLNNDATHVLRIVQAVAATEPAVADGLAFDIAGARAEVIRESDEILRRPRVHELDPGLSKSSIPRGRQRRRPDLARPARRRGSAAARRARHSVRGYTMEMALAEKIVTAVQRGTASTRWRDFGDIWTLSHNHALEGTDLHEAIRQVATHREVDLYALKTVLIGYADLAQAKWAQWRRKLKLDHLPAEFAEVLTDCIEFSDPALRGEVTRKTWDPSTQAWS